MKKSMIQRLGCLVASISFAFVGATAFADAWFTAKESKSSDLLTTGGTWTKDDASWDASTQTYNNFNTPLKFEATESKSNIASITTSVKFTAKDELTTEEIAGAKGGLAVLEAEDGSETNYWGVVSGAWVKLAGAKPDLTQAVTASISLFTVGKDASKKTYINYTIGSTPLTVGGNADILTEVDDASIQSVEYLGKCELASLSGATAAPYVAQGDDEKFYKTIAEAGNQAVTIVNATSYTPTATTIGSCNISDPDGFLTLNQGTLANVGLKVATVNGQVAIRPNFKSNNGDGTSAATAWEIGSAADLEAFRLGVNNNKFGGAGQYFKQTANIALTGVWEGIGKYGKDNAASSLNDFKAGAFQGTYDGGNNSITGLKLKSDFAQGTATNKYIGFFFSTYEATIKNAKFGIVNFGWDKGKEIDQDVGAGIVVGTAWNSTFENVEIIKGTETGTDEFYGTHAISAFVGYTTGTNLFTNCTNSIKLNENRDGSAKVGAFSACNQKNDPVLTFVNCVNKGDIYSTKGSYVAGFSAYNDGAAKFTNCSNKGNVTAGETGQIAQFAANNNGSATNLGGCSGLTTLIAVNKSGTDFNFATIAGEPAVATFVKNADLAAGNTYKVMAPIAAPAANIELAKGQTIAFDNALYPTFDATAKIVAAVPDSTKITSDPSGTVTTFTCAEKAKATVSITMTGATATVSVANGASVYEGTTITVTDTAAIKDYEAPIKVTINGVEQNSYTTTASDDSIAIEITATSKIVPIKPDPTLPEITVNKDDFPGMDIDAITTYLKEEQDNKLPGWVNYALGIGDNVKPQIGVDPKDESADAINILGNFNIKEGTGVEVKCTINGEEGEAIPVSGLNGTAKTFDVVVTVGGKTVVSKTIGANKVTTKADGERTLVSVPWSDGEKSLTLDKLFKTTHLLEGDLVEAYDTANDTYYKWAWTGSAWQKPEAAKKFLLGGSEIVQPSAEVYTVAPGQALWLTTTVAAEVIQLGDAPATFVGTTVAENQWGLVANPLSGVSKKLGAIVGEVTEGVTVQMEDSEGATHLYTYEGGEWGYNGYTKVEKTVRGKTTYVAVPAHIAEDPDIAPGKGFWFLNEGSSAATLDWNPESVAD